MADTLDKTPSKGTTPAEKNMTPDQIKKLQRDYENALRENEKLQARLETEVAKKPDALPTHEHEGVTYEQQIPKFAFKGQVHTYETLKGNKEVIAELLKIKSGVLRPKEA